MNADEQYLSTAERYYNEILRYCLSLLHGDLSTAEDCTQDVFLLMFEKKNALDFTQNIRGWLYASAERICKDYLKRESKRLSHLSADWNETENISAPSPFPDRESIFDVLTSEEYQLLDSYYSEDYGKRRQLAALYGMTPAQLSKKIHFIRQKLLKRAKYRRDKK